MSTNPILSKHEDVVELATKIGQDIGGVANLQTTNKTSVVGAINEVLTASVSLEISMENDFAKKTDLTPLAKKTDLTPLATKAAVAKDIGKLTDLPTSNKTSVVASINEIANEIGGGFEDVYISIANMNTEVDSTYAKKSELTPLVTMEDFVVGINDLASELSEVIEDLHTTTSEIYAEKSELTPLATKADVSKDIGNLANLPTEDKTSVVASINELLNNVNLVFGGVNTAINNIHSDYAKKTELAPLATKTDVAKDIGVVTNLKTTNKTNLVAAINELKTADTSFTNTYAKKTELTPLAKKTDLTPLATKVELTQAIADLINGADADSDTLKELADKITALAQADKGLVSASSAQSFNATQKKRARDNIGAISEADVNGILEAKSGGGYVSAYLQASQ